ncbi:MAG: hypothetical protein WC916_07255 [Candidatus Woesearchaeota archaeon]
MSIHTHVQSLLKDTATKIQDAASSSIAKNDYEGFLKSIQIYDKFITSILESYEEKGFRNDAFMPDNPAEEKVINEIFGAMRSCELPANIVISDNAILFYGGFGRIGNAELSLEYSYGADFTIDDFLMKNAINYPLETKKYKLYEFKNKYFYTNEQLIGYPFFTRWTKSPRHWKE